MPIGQMALTAISTKIFFGAGVVIVVLSVFSVLISIALIVFGIWLFLQGRNDRRSAGVTQGFFVIDISLVHDTGHHHCGLFTASAQLLKFF